MAKEVSGIDRTEQATWGRVLVAVAFFAYCFLFIWRYVDTQLLYHGDMVVLAPEWRIMFPWFQASWDFLGEQSLKPGGLAQYLGAWLAQYFYYPTLGALIFSLLGVALFVGTGLLARVARIRGRWTTSYLPALTVLGIAGAYAFPLAELVGVVLALSAVGIYALVATCRVGVLIRCVVYGFLCVLTYWTAGGNCLLVAVLCALIEWRRGSSTWLCAAYLAFGCVVLLAGTYVYLTHQPDEGFHFTVGRLWTETYKSAIPTAVYSGQIAVMFGWSGLLGWRSKRANKRAAADQTPRDQWFRDTVGVALLAGVTALASFGVLDTEARPLLRANYLARMGRWSEMLEEIAAQPPGAYPPCLLYDINRALYETGQLPDQLFSFPQDPQYLLQVGKQAVPYRGCQDLLMALGCVNELEQTACEALEVRGPLPYVLRELILINVVKDRPEAARVFLNLLARDVIHRQWARDFLRRMDDDPRLDGDEEVAKLRRAMLREDRISLASYELFDLLLERDPHDRMAFEYRMAYWLLTCQLDKISEQIPAMRELGFERIPTSYAEALLLNWRLNNQQPDLGDWRIESETMERFKMFVEMTRNAGRDPAALAQLGSGTFYGYFFARTAMSQ